MSTLVRVLYPEPATTRNAGSLLAWWESRRLLYNAVVGGVGFVTLSGISFLSWLPGGPDGLPLGVVVPTVVLYGVAANVCYTFGWLAELAASWVWGNDAPKIGPFLFREGLFFSIGLTFLPLGIVAVLAGAGVLMSAIP